MDDRDYYGNKRLELAGQVEFVLLLLTLILHRFNYYIVGNYLLSYAYMHSSSYRYSLRICLKDLIMR